MRSLLRILGACFVLTICATGSGNLPAVEQGQLPSEEKHNRIEGEAEPDQLPKLIFADGFESGDTSFWVQPDCTSTLIMPTAVVE